VGAAFVFSGWDRSLYMGLILVWACPVIAGMWMYAGQWLWAMRRAVLVSVTIPTVYLWIADAVAIRLGVWEISNTYTFGLQPLGLPIEEATFFLATNLLVVYGTLLFLSEPSDRAHGVEAERPRRNPTAELYSKQTHEPSTEEHRI